MNLYWRKQSISEYAQLPSACREAAWHKAHNYVMRQWQTWALIAIFALIATIIAKLIGVILFVLWVFLGNFVLWQYIARRERGYLRQFKEQMEKESSGKESQGLEKGQ